MYIKPWCHDCEWRENPEIMLRMMEERLPFMSASFMRYGRPPMYDQHRNAWVQTGDEDELRRMTEHVTWEPS
jgi:hypothetical protein